MSINKFMDNLFSEDNIPKDKIPVEILGSPHLAKRYSKALLKALNKFKTIENAIVAYTNNELDNFDDLKFNSESSGWDNYANIKKYVVYLSSDGHIDINIILSNDTLDKRHKEIKVSDIKDNDYTSGKVEVVDL